MTVYSCFCRCIMLSLFVSQIGYGQSNTTTAVITPSTYQINTSHEMPEKSSNLQSKPHINTEDIKQQLQASMLQFKKWFKVDVYSEKQMTQVAVELTQQYYAKLRVCTPGTYHYPEFNPLIGWPAPNQSEPWYFLYISKIEGMKSDKCIVDKTIDRHDKISNYHCEFTVDSLAYFTDGRAKNSGGDYSNYVKDDVRVAQKVLNACKLQAAH